MTIHIEDDAFGSALRDYAAGTYDGGLTLERDDGWTGPATHPALFFARPEQWPRWEQDVLSQVRAGPVLDIGAGAGRHALYLQSKGVDVTAFDASPDAVTVCAARGVRNVRLGDIDSLPTDRRWTAVLLLGGNLGLAGSWGRTWLLLRDLARIVTPDGVVIGDSVDPSHTEVPEHRAYQNRKRQEGNYFGEVRLRLRYGYKVTPWWDQLNVAFDDAEALVDGTGWRIRDHPQDGADHAVVLVRE